MKIARIDNRAHLIHDTAEALLAIDIGSASEGQLPTSTKALLARIGDLKKLSRRIDWAVEAVEVQSESLQTPIPDPSQILAVGMNYQDHADEVDIATPDSPAIFTKFQSSLTGADSDVALPSASVDWEAELVAVIGEGGRQISQDRAWNHIAGYAVGQDLSCRELQFAATSAPQFSLGKSYEGFAPIGPWITTAEEVEDPTNLEINCRRGDEILQQGTTAKLVFDIPTLIEHFSSVIELRPGDLIFTGTPHGVGFGRDPQVFLRSGDTLTSSISGLGSIVQRFH